MARRLSLQSVLKKAVMILTPLRRVIPGRIVATHMGLTSKSEFEDTIKSLL